MIASRALLLLALALPLAVAPTAGAATPKPPIRHATMIYYAVGGATPAQLRERLDARSPKSPDGYRGDAYTRWEYRWNWPGYGTAGCSLAQAVVTVRVVVSFPRWTHPKAAPASLVAAWTRYTRALARHEQGHVDYAVGAPCGGGAGDQAGHLRQRECGRAPAARRHPQARRGV